MVYRFVQLSDIHFGQERDGVLHVHEDIRDKLIADAEKLAATRGSAHLVIVAGDIAYSGKEPEYKRAGEWLDKLTKSVGCAENEVRVVPGNHDCDRAQLTRLATMAHRTIRQGTPKSAYADLEDIAREAEEANPVLLKLKSYLGFALGYESEFSAQRPYWTKDIPLAPGIDLRLVGMTSVQVSDSEDRPGNMILGASQYVLPEHPSRIYAVVMHHPLDWYMDKPEARPYLSNRARLVMVGHEHIPNIEKTVDILRNEWLCIYSGAATPQETGALYRYAYNWMEVTLREQSRSYCLDVTVFPRVWIPERTRFDADRQRLQGQESATFEIACTDVRPNPDAPSWQEARPAEEPIPRAKVLGTGGGTMGMRDDAAVSKLKFMFWRYLDWRQRLKVLVEADALPASPESPLPQTMERLALEDARARGKLPAIWDAMMGYVPEDKRQANPFR